jgi:hypothetical protein
MHTSQHCVDGQWSCSCPAVTSRSVSDGRRTRRHEITEEQRVAIEETLVTGCRRQIMEAEAAVWAVLTEAQISALCRMVDDSDEKHLQGRPEKAPVSFLLPAPRT